MAPNSDRPPAVEFSFRTRLSAWEALKKNPDQTLPMIIVGGGVVGAGLLREVSARGLKNVYLFEKNDFASGTSGASSKLIHAGIRYLEQVWVHLKQGRIRQALENLRFVIQASKERKTLGHLAPGLIRPKPIYLVLSKNDPRSVLSVIAGVSTYYLMQLFQGQFFRPPAFYFMKGGIESLKGELNLNRVKAVFSFWDSETDDARLVIENLQSAAANGGNALNYVEMVDFQKETEDISVTFIDKETGEKLRCKTKVLINATGAHVDETRARERNRVRADEALIDRVAGSHLNVYPAITDRSYYVSADDNRLVFVLRRDEDGLVYSRIGTTERPLAPEESSDRPRATEREISYLKDLTQAYFPKAVLDDSTVITTDAGIRPLRSQVGLTPFQKSREHDIIEDRGVFHIVGVKLTDFRRVSEEIADRLKIPRSIETQRSWRPNASRIYIDQSVRDVIDHTMPLHWDDYVLRRGGLRPLVQLRQKPELFKKEFEEFSRCMGWEPAKRDLEWKKVRP